MRHRRAGILAMPAPTEIRRQATLERGALTLRLLPGVGGRLWDVVHDGRSLLFQNPDLVGQTIDLAALTDLPTRSPQFGFPLWGGEKTWVAPDTDWVDAAPYPVLDSGPYRIRAQTTEAIEMISPICPLSQLVVSRRIAILSASHWSIRHLVENAGGVPRRAGIWSVMMLDHPAKIGVPCDAPAIRRVFGQPGDTVGIRAPGLLCDCAAPSEFKVGLPNPSGRVLLRCGTAETWMLCDTGAARPETDFAHGHPFEVFNSGDYAYCEAEWHSPAAVLAPGASMSFHQTFHIWSGDTPPDPLNLTAAEKELMRCMC